MNYYVECISDWNLLNVAKNTSITSLFPRFNVPFLVNCVWQLRQFGNCSRRCSTSSILVVVRANYFPLIYMDVLYAAFAGAKNGHEKILINRSIFKPYLV